MKDGAAWPHKHKHTQRKHKDNKEKLLDFFFSLRKGSPSFAPVFLQRIIHFLP